MLKNSLDKIVKDKLNGVGVEPPAYVWNSINQRILADKQRKRILLYWQSAAAVALVVLSVGIIYFMSERTVRKRQMAKVEKPVMVKGAEVEKITPFESVKKANSEQVITVSTVVTRTKSGKTGKKEETVTESSANSELELEEFVIEKSSTPYNQSEMVSEGEIAEGVSVAKMEHLPTPAIESSVPKAELLLPEQIGFKSLALYASNTVMPIYKSKTKRYKFVLGGSASPTYNYRNVSESQNSSVVRSANYSSTSETGIVSVSGGVNIRMEGKSRWSFETGVLYSQVGQEVSQSTIYNSNADISSFASTNSNVMKDTYISNANKFSNSLGAISYNNNTSMGVEQNLLKSGVYLESSVNTVNNQSESAALKQLLDYIEVPLMVRYSVFNKKPVVTLAGGFSTNFLVDNNVYVIENGEHVNAGETDGINGVTYSSTVGIGLELPLGKSFRFSVEPRFKYYLSPVNSQGNNSYRPYSFGVFGGVSFIFNNH